MNTTTNTNSIKYELVVERLEDGASLMGRYTAFIYASRVDGMCGPWTAKVVFEGMGAAIDYAETFGFVVDGWPEIKNDTAFYPLTTK